MMITGVCIVSSTIFASAGWTSGAFGLGIVAARKSRRISANRRLLVSQHMELPGLRQPVVWHPHRGVQQALDDLTRDGCWLKLRDAAAADDRIQNTHLPGILHSSLFVNCTVPSGMLEDMERTTPTDRRAWLTDSVLLAVIPAMAYVLAFAFEY